MDGMLLPITPSSLDISVGSTNSTVTLINEGEINILKSPGLIEVSFEARFPMRDYPYSKTVRSFQSYYDKIKTLKESKKPFNFIVVRTTPNGIPTWDTNLTVALESFEISEDADEGDDVLISFELKQYKPYGTKVISVKNNNVRPTGDSNRVTQQVTQKSYTVKSGDTLWKIAKVHYGNGAQWTTIYNTNKNAIEDDAKRHGKASSSNGHWIWPDLQLTLPGA